MNTFFRSKFSTPSPSLPLSKGKGDCESGRGGWKCNDFLESFSDSLRTGVIVIMGEQQNGVQQLGVQIIGTLSELMPERSMSFSLSEEGFEAVRWLVELTKEKMPKNMHVLKESALEALTQISKGKAGTPLNVNFSEDELKALAKVLEIAEREVD